MEVLESGITISFLDIYAYYGSHEAYILCGNQESQNQARISKTLVLRYVHLSSFIVFQLLTYYVNIVWDNTYGFYPLNRLQIKLHCAKHIC